MVAMQQPMHDATVHATCGGKCRDGHLCTNPPMTGRTRCRMHGGASPVGIASATFKHGKYSAYMPDRLLERYHDAVADPALLEQTHEIALVDSRLADLLTRVDTGEAGVLWEKARKATSDIRKALHNENYGGVMEAALELDNIIGSGLTDFEAWNQISALLSQRRQLVESQRKRMIEQQQFVTVEQALLLVTAMINSVKEHVTDRAALNAISMDVAKLTNRVSIEAVNNG